MSPTDRLKFVAHRLAPFVLLLLYDCVAFAIFYLLPDRIFIPAPVFWTMMGLVPAIILFGGGYAVRRLNPRSQFGWLMILLSAIVLILNAPIPGCYDLYLRGGHCT